jgi:hypothetical protein
LRAVPVPLRFGTSSVHSRAWGKDRWEPATFC